MQIQLVGTPKLKKEEPPVHLSIAETIDGSGIYSKAGIDFNSFNGQKAKEALDSLRIVVQDIKVNREKYYEFELLIDPTHFFLMEVLMGCWNHPGDTFKVYQ